MKLHSYSLVVAAALLANAAFAADVPVTGAPVKSTASATAAVDTKTEVKKQEATTTMQKAATDVKQTANVEKTAAHKHANGAMKPAKAESKVTVKTGEGPKVETSTKAGK